MSEETILYERQESVAKIIINRPEKLNALDLVLLENLDAAVAKAANDSDVRAIVITGAGDKAFVAGGDIADLNSRRGLEHYLQFAEQIHGVFRRIETVDKPTIGAINGWALGGGAELLLCLDIRLAAQRAKIGVPEITLGLFPGAGGSQRLIRQVPLCRAKELMFIGQPVSATEALELGLINRVCGDEELMTEAMTMAASIAEKSPLTLKLLKRTIADGLDMALPASLRHEQAMISLTLDSEDAHEGCSAFLDKRTAKFEGQ